MNQTKSKGTMHLKYKILNSTKDPLAYFNNLKKGKKDVFLLESADVIEKFGEKTIGCVDPCLKITIKDYKFKIKALNNLGEALLKILKDDFKYASNIIYKKNQIQGLIKKNKELLDEDSRLKQTSVFDVLRTIAFKFKPNINLPIPTSGLFGIIGYDAIDYFEKLPKNKQKNNSLPDIEFYFADKLFVMDHIHNKTYLIGHQFVINNKEINTDYEIIEKISEYEKKFNQTKKFTAKKSNKINSIKTSIPDNKFKDIVKKLKQHISVGDIFQCIISRSYKTNINEDPLDIYARLKTINPGPYMFYFENKNYTLLGSSPETCLKVSRNKNKSVEINPIAGTLPRGKKGNKIDPELDSRIELDLLLDEKELAEHCMLVDLARNDIAKVSKPGTRTTPQILKIQKFSHVQHLVSNVTGQLRDDLDALHAYTATMNMGTLTGAPKIKAMELIRKYENQPREFYGGAVGYLTPNGEFDSCIIIRSMTIQNNQAKIQVGAGVVYDSDPENENIETKRKANACLQALGVDL